MDTFVYTVRDAGSGGWTTELAVRAPDQRAAYATLRDIGLHKREFQFLPGTRRASNELPWPPTSDPEVVLRRRLGLGEAETWEAIIIDELETQWSRR